MLALSRVRGLGPVSLKALVRTYSNLGAVWSASPAELRSVLAEAQNPNAEEAIDQIMSKSVRLQELARRDRSWLIQHGVALLTPIDEEYPGQLVNLPDRPEWLFVQGDVSLLSMVSLVAVVGTREATQAGLRRTRRLTTWLAEKGFGIVAGLAEGIDEEAHESALNYGAPTIAVLGNGINVVFPTKTRHLRGRILAEGGAIVTEYFPNERYSRENFIQRNRIQAGLAYATVPVEARVNSGTAHTYRFARKYARLVFGISAKDDLAINGILDLIIRDGYRVFDLDNPSSMGDLESLLEHVTPDQPVKQRLGRIYRGVLRGFDEVLDRHTVSDDDFDDLVSRLQHLRGRRRNGD